MVKAFARPRTTRKFSPLWLVPAAVAAIGVWLYAENNARRIIHPGFPEMIAAARVVQSASLILRTEKQARGLLQPPDIDPNRTGMIGSEYTSITTTLGDIGSKRTATNPDIAALFVRLLATLELRRGTPVVIVTSGSFAGGNIAAIAAAEALGLRPLIITSLGSSMYGANDPDFNWLDMLALLRAKGAVQSSAIAAVVGGESATGSSMEPEGLAALRATAARHNVPLIEKRPLSVLVDALMESIARNLGPNVHTGAVINVGGALIGLGTCKESYELPPGILKGVACHEGTPGLAFRLAESGLPMLNVINFRRLAIEYGLPFDPSPLPMPGDNRAVYGSARNNPN